jgi:hypothetical protein
MIDIKKELKEIPLKVRLTLCGEPKEIYILATLTI